MKRDHFYLQDDIDFNQSNCISYSQLKRIMKTFDYAAYNSINEAYFGRTISGDGLEWSAIDGKELRGTIDKVAGEKRNENIVQKITHHQKQSSLIGFYNGSKESEITVVLNHIEQQKTLDKKAYSFDALHTHPPLLEMVSAKGGIYLAQVKKNQSRLLDDCQHTHEHLKAQHIFDKHEKGHGRLEQRHGFLYPLNYECLDDRWSKTAIKSLIVVERSRQQIKTGRISHETAYFISNQELSNDSSENLFHAVREHWSVESDNNTRDTNLGEDQIISFHSNTSRTMAVCISWSLNLLRRHNKSNNIRELREDLSSHRDRLSSILETQ